VISDAADLLCDGKIIGWFDGGAELGPRALGQRSILCDPRRPDAKDTLNLRVKMREPFRPFAPAVLLEEAPHWFDFDGTPTESPFMLRVIDVKPEKKNEVPSIVHVDGTGRVQTLTRANNGRFYDLVRKFYEKTGVPVLLNTSFNRMGEPIIETPGDAIGCLLKTGLDCCVFEDRIVFKK
jgi:carbamoyltransferase